MEAYLLMYLWFAVSTALWACLSLVTPVIKRQREKGKKPLATITYISCFCSFLLFAPLVLLCILNDTLAILFMDKLSESMFPEVV